MTKQDFIITQAVRMVEYTNEIAGYEYDTEAAPNEAIKEMAYTELEKFNYLLNELKNHISSYNLLNEVKAEAIAQGGIERLI